MQIATLSYQYGPKDPKSKYQRRQILTTVSNPSKKTKPRAFQPDVTTNSTHSLPAINKNSKRPSSIRIKGNGLQSSKLNDTSTSSFQQPSRSRSQQSEKSDVGATRSRSITPTGGGGGNGRTSSKLVRLRFGYPVKMRSADFYAPDLSESELRFREDSFVNDSIRASNERHRNSKNFSYNAFDDPNLQQFFQSSVVLDVVRRTLNIDLESTPTGKKKRSKRNDSNSIYGRIVAKHSSGYGKLNGYDCLPPFAPGRQRRSLTQDRYHSSANTSFNSFPTYNSLSNQPRQRSRSKKTSKPLTPISTSSPLRHPTNGTGVTAESSHPSQD